MNNEPKMMSNQERRKSGEDVDIASPPMRVPSAPSPPPHVSMNHRGGARQRSLGLVGPRFGSHFPNLVRVFQEGENSLRLLPHVDALVLATWL